MDKRLFSIFLIITVVVLIYIVHRISEIRDKRILEKIKHKDRPSRSNITGLSNNIPSSQKAQTVGDTVMRLSHELKCIIVAQNCVDFNKINLGGLEYALFMYDLDCYRQVMTLKHSNFYIESTIRTIFISMESNMRKYGNNISDGYLFNTFTKLSNALNNAFRIANDDGVDGFYGVAEYLLLDECGMSEEEINANMDLVIKIAEHFNKIVNLPINIIL